MTGSSGAGVSPATAPMRDGGSHGDQEGGSRSFHQRKRRRVGRGGDGVLSNALAGYLGWQQTAEERFLTLEEARMRQETRAEERREQQEERRAKQERDHEFRLMSMLTKVLSSTRGTEDPSASTRRETLPVPSTSQTLLPSSAKAVPSMLWGDQTAQYSPYLSRRGNSMRLHQGILQEGYNQYCANKHNENSNPHVSLPGNSTALLLLIIADVFFFLLSIKSVYTAIRCLFFNHLIFSAWLVVYFGLDVEKYMINYILLYTLTTGIIFLKKLIIIF